MKLNFLKRHREESENSEQRGRINKWLWIPLVAIFFIIILLIGLAVGFAIAYQHKILPGVRVASVSVGGMTKENALAELNLITDKISASGINILYKEGNNSYLKVAPAVNSLSPDSAREIITFNNDQAVDNAFAIGRGRNWIVSVFNTIRTMSSGIKIQASVQVETDSLKQIIKDQFADLEKPGTDAKPVITWVGDSYSVNISPEQNGESFGYDRVMATIVSNLKNLNSEPVTISKESSIPVITRADAEANKGLIQGTLATSTTLTFNTVKWQLTPQALSPMLEFRKINNEIKIGLNSDLWQKWVDKNLAPEINIEAQDARIEMASGTIMKITSHKSGRKINADKLYQDVVAGLSIDNRLIEIAVIDTVPNVTVDNVNNLGIKEIIGVGKSNFAGSPTNRRWNIKTGASKLQGVLIKPGEEFSLITALGEIDASTGYRTELVIKDNKTTPEFGGGLCQIGTTTFRAAMDAGLPITERRSHSYNVGYYLENGLPGVDATIYQPHPDVRFINDTGNYILIQYTIKGNDLAFEFWGTRDGRKAERTKPKVWGWVSPPPMKTIETTNLAPGVKKCTESAHKGVDASFNYSITYASGEVKKQTFSSHYKPWQAVCLIGVAQLTEIPAIVPTSTEPLIL